MQRSVHVLLLKQRMWTTGGNLLGLDGRVIGMTTYGESAPAKDLYQHFGITTDAVVAAVKEITA